MLGANITQGMLTFNQPLTPQQFTVDDEVVEGLRAEGYASAGKFRCAMCGEYIPLTEMHDFECYAKCYGSEQE